MFNKKTNCNLTLAALLLGALFAPAQAQVSASPSVPPGTEIIVKTVDAMNSKTAKTGDKFVVEVAKDVVVDQQVVIAAGTRGTGTIIFARAKRSGGVSGALDVRVDSIDTPNGPLKLKASDANRGADRRGAGTAAQMAFGLIGFLAVQGEEISLNPGTEIHTVVPAPRSIAAPAASAAATPAANPIAVPAPEQTASNTTTSTEAPKKEQE